MNYTKEYIIENTTVLVLGHNVKHFVSLAIESLLSVSKFKREQILYFDDLSTDGSIEEMKSRNIKCISWDKETYDEFMSNEEINKSLPIRVSAILNSAYKQINTEYVFIIDSDDIFLQDPTEFIFDYFIPYNSNTDCIIFAMDGGFREDKNNEEFFSVWQNCMYFNKSVLEKENALGDDIREILAYKKEDYGYTVEVYETGLSQWKKLRKIENQNRISCINIESEIIQNYFLEDVVLHIGLLSSYVQRGALASGKKKEDLINDFNIFKRNDVVETCKKIGLSPSQILNSIIKV